VAADTASDAPNCGDLSVPGVLSRGNSTSTSPTQNTKRSRKNISHSGRLSDPVAIVIATAAVVSPLSLTVVHKLQVFALRLNLRKFSKISNDLIRRKFSIDAGLGDDLAAKAVSTISKPYRIRAGNPAFTIRVDCAAWRARMPRDGKVIGREFVRLSVRLISL
jgi:hypothetical protein